MGRRILREIPTKDILCDLYIVKKLSSIKIAKIFECSDHCICDYLKKYNIKRYQRGELIKGKNNGRYTNGVTLKKYYCIDCKTEIGRGAKSRCEDCDYISREGKGNSMYGKKHSKESLKKMSLSHGGTGILGECREYTVEWTDDLRDSIRKRDAYKCQICEKTQEQHIQEYNDGLPIHHINYNKKNCEENNLITLCYSCHGKTLHNRYFWELYFNIYIAFIDNNKGVKIWQ